MRLFNAEVSLPCDGPPTPAEPLTGVRSVTVDTFLFGDSVEMADELLELVLQGPKRATAGAVAEYAAEGIGLPCVGDFSVVCGGRARRER